MESTREIIMAENVVNNYLNPDGTINTATLDFSSEVETPTSEAPRIQTDVGEFIDVSKVEFPEVKDASTIVEIGTGLSSSLFKTWNESAKLLNDMAPEWIQSDEPTPFTDWVLEQFDIETQTEKVSQNVGQVVLGLLLTRNLAAPAGAGTGFQVGSSMTRGAIIDAVSWGEDDDRIADVLADNGVQNAVIDFLESNPDDSKSMDTLKHVIEGAFIGGAAEATIIAIVKSYQGLRALFNSSGKTHEDLLTTLEQAKQNGGIQPANVTKLFKGVGKEVDVKPFATVTPGKGARGEGFYLTTEKEKAKGYGENIIEVDLDTTVINIATKEDMTPTLISDFKVWAGIEEDIKISEKVPFKSMENALRLSQGSAKAGEKTLSDFLSTKGFGGLSEANDFVVYNGKDLDKIDPAIGKSPERTLNFNRTMIDKDSAKHIDSMITDNPTLRADLELDTVSVQQTMTKAKPIFEKLESPKDKVKYMETIFNNRRGMPTENTVGRLIVHEAWAKLGTNINDLDLVFAKTDDELVKNIDLLVLKTFAKESDAAYAEYITSLWKGTVTATGRGFQSLSMNIPGAGKFDMQTFSRFEDELAVNPIKASEFKRQLSEAMTDEQKIQLIREAKKIHHIQKQAYHKGAAKRVLDTYDSKAVKSLNVAFEVMYAGMLSNPWTHVFNMAGGTFTTLNRYLEHTTAAGVGRVLGTTDRIKANELLALRYGFFKAWGDTGMNAYSALKHYKGGTAEIEDAFEIGLLARESKVESEATRAVSSEYLLQSGKLYDDTGKLIKEVPPSHTVDTIGAVNRGVLHLLSLEDDLFKRINYNSYIGYKAVHNANQKGLLGKEFETFVTEFQKAHELYAAFQSGHVIKSVENKKLIEKYVLPNKAKYYLEGIEEARYATFTNELGETGKKLNEIRGGFAGGVLKIPFPFGRTPTNIVKYIGQRTPVLNALSSTNQKMWAEGGRARDLVIARTGLGLGFISLGWNMGANHIFVGNAPEGQRATLNEAGFKEGSINIHGKSYPVDRADPVIAFMMMGADMQLYWTDMERRGKLNIEGFQEEYKQVMSALVLSISKNSLSDLWFSGANDIFKLVQYGNKDNIAELVAEYSKNRLAQFIPFGGFTGWWNTNPEATEAKTLVEKFQKKWSPHLLRPALDSYGKTQPKEHLLGLEIGTENLSPIRKEMLRLGSSINKIGDKIKFQSTTLELEDPLDVWKLQRIVGSVLDLEGQLNKRIQKADYKASPPGLDWTVPGTKKYMLNQIISQAHQEAKKIFIRENSDKLEELKKEYLKNVKSLGFGTQSLGELGQ